MTDLGHDNRTRVAVPGCGTFEPLQPFVVGNGRRNVEEESLRGPGQAVGARIKATCHQNSLPAGTTSLVRTVGEWSGKQVAQAEPEEERYPVTAHLMYSQSRIGHDFQNPVVYESSGHLIRGTQGCASRHIGIGRGWRMGWKEAGSIGVCILTGG